MSEFNAKQVKDDCVQWIKDWFAANGYGCNAIVGISGGIDSSVVAALCVEALGKDRVFGVLMPQGVQSDIEDAYKLCQHLDIRFVRCDINDAVNDVLTSISEQLVPPFGVSEQARINLPPRIRMSTLYAVSQSMNGRVANTCNLSEDWVGYNTLHGDSVGDFSPLSNLTKTEVKAIGYELGLPKELIEKTPSDGLCGITDEERFGFTYAELDKYIRDGVIENVEHQELIETMHNQNEFKLQPMPKFEYKVVD